LHRGYQHFESAESKGCYLERGRKPLVLLDAEKHLGKLHFSHMATAPQFVPVEVVTDFDFPQREAAFFYGLFLRGHSASQLRRDIEVPPAVLAKWHKESLRDPQLRDVFSRMLDYRRHVLAIFDTLVGSDVQNYRVQ
jgi:hypothetical protein